MRCVVSCGGTSCLWLVFFFRALVYFIYNECAVRGERLLLSLIEDAPTKVWRRPHVKRSRLFSSLMYDQSGHFVEREFAERKWVWSVRGNLRSKVWNASSARADWLIAVCHLNFRDTLLVASFNAEFCPQRSLVAIGWCFHRRYVERFTICFMNN